jgi:hypothetical protein
VKKYVELQAETSQLTIAIDVEVQPTMFIMFHPAKHSYTNWNILILIPKISE